MAKITIRVPEDPPHRPYMPKELVAEGFTGEVEILADAFTATLLKPGASLEQVRDSLKLVLKDVELRLQDERRKKNNQQ